MPAKPVPWSIHQTNFGELGWVSRPDGYGYEPLNGTVNAPWPAIPAALLALWDEIAGYPAPPECCLVNLYDAPKSRMGLHRDEDEAALDAPVLSVSLGDTCVFRVGGFARSDKSKSFRLASYRPAKRRGQAHPAPPHPRRDGGPCAISARRRD